MTGPGFAVLDFQTTGPAATGADRVVEIAVVHLAETGTITGRWDTLVNPLRSTGPRSLHRISPTDVLNAPTFAEAAPQLVELLGGRVLVGHDIDVSTPFLDAELGRLDYATPSLTLSALCTLELAKLFLPRSRSRTLGSCCAKYAIPHAAGHRALSDAEATAHLLSKFISIAPHARIWADTIASARARPWPHLDWPASDWFGREDVQTAA